MKKEIFEALKENNKKYYYLSEVAKTCLNNIGRENCVFKTYKQSKHVETTWLPCNFGSGSHFSPSDVYRIKYSCVFEDFFLPSKCIERLCGYKIKSRKINSYAILDSIVVAKDIYNAMRIHQEMFPKYEVTKIDELENMFLVEKERKEN